MRNGTSSRRRSEFWTGLLFVAVTAWVYAFTLTIWRFYQPASQDDLYHYAVATRMAQGILAPEKVASLPWSILTDMPVDHYFGYHALLSLFAFSIPDPYGMKIATATLFSAVPTSIYLFLWKRGVSRPWLFALVAILLANQDWRYLMLRGGHLLAPLSLLFAEFAFFSRLRGRRLALLLVSYIALISYQGGLILLPLYVGVRGAQAFFQPIEWKSSLLDVLTILTGFICALLLNPYMDLRGSTFRFLIYHVGYMNLDPLRLYPGLREFGPVPLQLLWRNPTFLLVPLFTVLLVLGLLCRRNHIKAKEPLIITAAMAVTGLALAARAIRMREYAVPWMLCFAGLAIPALLASLPSWTRALESRKRSSLYRFESLAIATLLCLGLAVKWPTTWAQLGQRLPSNSYSGARDLLEENDDAPVLNIAEGDYTTLRWEAPSVSTVQGLSRYFLSASSRTFRDVWRLKKGPLSDDEAIALLKTFQRRGIRLVATRRDHRMYPLMMRYPELYALRYESLFQGSIQYEGAAIFQLLEEAAPRIHKKPKIFRYIAPPLMDILPEPRTWN